MDRKDSDLFPGGDTVQINAIAKFLIENGYAVTKHRGTNIEVSNYDLALIFNLTRPFDAYLQVKEIIKINVPYLFFPVYWNLDSLRMEDLGIRNWIKNKLPFWLKSILKAISYKKELISTNPGCKINLLEIYNIKSLSRFILNHARFICPNSYAELEHLEQVFEIWDLKEKSVIIQNGVDYKKIVEASSHNLVSDIKLPEKYVCCIGGIGPRKNQLNLVKAANRAGIPLVIVGKPSNTTKLYADYINRIAKENVVFVDFLKQKDVFAILKRSQGHIQPSYIETPGLVSLEAAVIGCPIGVGETPPVIEYFGEKAIYCNPYSIESIEKCLKTLYESKEKKGYAEEFSKYDWANILKPLPSLIDSSLEQERPE